MAATGSTPAVTTSELDQMCLMFDVCLFRAATGLHGSTGGHGRASGGRAYNLDSESTLPALAKRLCGVCVEGHPTAPSSLFLSECYHDCRQ